ncbi:hypothetical protein ACFQXA_32160 [Nocardiopsis composta]
MGRASAGTRARRGGTRRRLRRAARPAEEGAGWRDPAAEPGLAPTQILLRGLFDDAGLFPPSPLPPFQAAQRNRSDRIIAHPMHSLRLMCPVGLLPELARAVGGDGSVPDAGFGGAADGALPSLLGVGGGEAFAGAVAIGEGGRVPGRGPGAPPRSRWAWCSARTATPRAPSPRTLQGCCPPASRCRPAPRRCAGSPPWRTPAGCAGSRARSSSRWPTARGGWTRSPR